MCACVSGHQDQVLDLGGLSYVDKMRQVPMLLVAPISWLASIPLEFRIDSVRMFVVSCCEFRPGCA